MLEMGVMKLRKSNIAFDNLRAEMSRKNIGITEMARTINVNRDTLARRLASKSRITLRDAFAIQVAFFPELDIRYLFHGAEIDEAAAEKDAS